MKTLLKLSSGDSMMKDALRDLIIVVMGILGALALESWWQDLQDRAEETELLAGLQDEFKSNYEQLDEIVSIWSDIALATDNAMTYMGRSVDTLDADEVIAVFRKRHSARFFDPRIGQLSSLINSGKLGLISNAMLRAKLADWPSLVDDLDVERQGTLFDLMESGGPRQRNYLPGGPTGGPFEDRLQPMLLDRDVYNDLYAAAGNTRRAIAEGQTILTATEEILDLIDTVLTDRQ